MGRGSQTRRAWRRSVQPGKLVLIAFSAVWLLPLAWVAAVALRSPDAPITRGSIWWAGSLSLDNFRAAWKVAPFSTYYVNTLVIVLGILMVQLVTMVLAGFVFAKLRFPGRNLLFGLFLAQLLLPSTALALPNYEIIRTLDLYDTRLAVMLPFFGSALGTFLLRQVFREVPQELEDAARVEGAEWWEVMRHVYLPHAIPTLLAYALVTLSSHWNDFFWPLLVTNSTANRPLTVGLATFTQFGQNSAQWPLICAGTLIVIWPLLVLFMLFQRQFIRSFALHATVQPDL